MPYSKTRVNRAGETLARFLRAYSEGGTTALEGLSLTDFEEAREIVDWWRRSHASSLSSTAANLRYYAAEQGRPVVAQRLKKLPTIADKLLREPRMKLSRMGDIGGVRAVLPNQDAAYAVARRLRRNWTITRIKDRVTSPKADGYRALHLYNRRRGRLIEIQLRTPGQHLWANAVEADARRFGLQLKSGGGPTELSEYYVATAELIATVDQGIEPSAQILERVRVLHARADTFRARSRNRN